MNPCKEPNRAQIIDPKDQDMSAYTSLAEKTYVALCLEYVGKVFERC